MRTTITPLLLGILLTAQAQHTDDFVRTHEVLGGGALFQECDVNGATTAYPDKVPVPGGARFFIVRVLENKDVQVQFNQWPGPTTQELSKMTTSDPYFKGATRTPMDETKELFARYPNFFKYNVHSETGDGHVDPEKGIIMPRFFMLTENELVVYARPLLSRFSPVYGAAILPFKIRPQHNDYAKDISLAGLGGVRFHTKARQFSIGAVAGIGLASVTLDSVNTEGKVLDAEDRSALSLPVGIVAEWDQLQFGVFAGWDLLPNRDRDGWIYQGAPWIGIGIGYAVFSEQKKEGRTDDAQSSGK